MAGLTWTESPLLCAGNFTTFETIRQTPAERHFSALLPIAGWQGPRLTLPFDGTCHSSTTSTSTQHKLTSCTFVNSIVFTNFSPVRSTTSQRPARTILAGGKDGQHGLSPHAPEEGTWFTRRQTGGDGLLLATTGLRRWKQPGCSALWRCREVEEVGFLLRPRPRESRGSARRARTARGLVYPASTRGEGRCHGLRRGGPPAQPWRSRGELQHDVLPAEASGGPAEASRGGAVEASRRKSGGSSGGPASGGAWAVTRLACGA